MCLAQCSHLVTQWNQSDANKGKVCKGHFPKMNIIQSVKFNQNLQILCFHPMFILTFSRVIQPNSSQQQLVVCQKTLLLGAFVPSHALHVLVGLTQRFCHCNITSSVIGNCLMFLFPLFNKFNQISHNMFLFNIVPN